MFLPFSRAAQPWEKIAAVLRRLAGVSSPELLDPWSLAGRVGLTVLDDPAVLSEVGMPGNGESCKWSGGVYPKPLPDGTFLCILNPAHSRRRNKITLMEEITHTYLRHQPCSVIATDCGIKVRDYNVQQEREAYGIGAAALLPWATLFPRLNSGHTVEDLSADYDVTPDLINYRIKVTGAYKLYSARQRH